MVEPSFLMRHQHRFSHLILITLALSLGSALADELTLPEWLLTTRMGGDFRYRYESIEAEGFERVNYRNRIRYRLWLKTAVNDRVTVGFRLASGQGDPRSTNQDLQDGFSGKPLVLDRAYATIRHRGWLTVTVGKQEVPYLAASQIIWDSDVNLEGGSARLETVRGWLTLSMTGGGYWIDEQSLGGGQGLAALQPAITAKRDCGQTDLALAYYDYSFVKDHEVIYSSLGLGNHTHFDHTRGTVYDEDFNVLNATLRHRHRLARTIELTLTAEYVQNTATDVDDDGVLGGLALTQDEGALPYSVSWDYRELAPDATIAMFTESDFAGGMTDSRGHKLTVSIKPLKNTSLGSTLYLNQQGTTDDAPEYTRLMGDFAVKF